MNLFTAILLGIIQGFTEFLPISSSAHLVFAQHFLPGFSQPGVLFDVVLHGGTLLAVILYFWKRLLNLSPKMIIFLFVGTIPAGLIGFLFETQLEASFGDVKSVGLQLIVTGIICYFIDKIKTKDRPLTTSNSFLIGIAQAIAIIPGISRSGATIFAGVAQGVDKQKVAEFSFLLSIPAIAGALVLQLIKYHSIPTNDLVPYVFGFVSAFVFGILSIKVLLRMLVTKNFKYFAIYAVVIGALVVLV